MFKSFVVLLALLGLCFHGLNAIDDIKFLQDASEKYSPALLKQLITERIDHEIEQIRKQSTTVGLNQQQLDLCSIIIQAFFTLRSDVQSMDSQQVICNDKAYSEDVTAIIKQFDYLQNLFESSFETFQTPNLTNDTPAHLLASITNVNLESIKNKMLESIKLYQADIKKVISAEDVDEELKVLGQIATRELTAITTKASGWARESIGKADLSQALEQFQEIIDVFYRQVEYIADSKKPTEVYPTEAYTTQYPDQN